MERRTWLVICNMEGEEIGCVHGTFFEYVNCGFDFELWQAEQGCERNNAGQIY